LKAFEKDQDNLDAANREVQDLLSVAQFNNDEKVRFLANVGKEMSKHDISLDSLARS